MRRTVVIVYLTLAWMSIGSAQGQICKWVDEDGITHYETRCPEDGRANVLDLDTGPGGDASGEAQASQEPERFEPLLPADNGQAEIALAPSQPSVLDNAQARDRCVRALTNLVVLQVQAPVFYDEQGVLHHGESDRARNYEGPRTYVSNRDRDEEILRYRTYLRDSCGQSQAEREGLADLALAQNLPGIQDEICADKENLMKRLQIGITGLPTTAAEELQSYLELNCEQGR